MSKTSARQKIMDAAQQLMTGKGYSATTVDEIIGQAGVAKGSFYHAFKSKEELALAALEDYLAKGMAVLADGEYLRIEDPVARALSFLTLLETECQTLWSHGCLLGSVSLEVSATHPAIRDKIDRLFSDFEAAVAAQLRPALAARQVSRVSAEDLSVLLLSVIEGAIIAARSHRNPEFLTISLRQFRFYVQCLLGEALA